MKIGIVGYGSIGKRHAINARALGHKVLVYDPLAASDVALERNIYEECDAVVIATPSHLHESGIRACIERGKHVLVEKPISTSLGHLAQLLDIAREKNLVVMIGNNLRFHPCVKQAKQWINTGAIGKPLWASFICAQETTKKPYLGDGVILNAGAHEVDLALHLLGPAKVVSASALSTDGHDYLADFVLEHQGGCRSAFHIDFVTPKEIREFWIAGQQNNIGVGLVSRHALLGDKSHPHRGSYDDDYIAEMQAFTDMIDNKLSIDGALNYEGLFALKVLLDVRKKAGLS